MSPRSTHQDQIEARVEETAAALIQHVRDEGRLAVIQAPPGSGKTYLLLQAVNEAYRRGQRVAIATQTRSQADDVCSRLLGDFGVSAIRFVARHGAIPNLPVGVQIQSDKKLLPTGPVVVVATTAKWGTVEVDHPFDLVVVEEAWQMAWADFMLLGQVAPRFVLIGDPGQIPPVVSIDASRWETAPLPPHRAAPELVRRAHPDALDLRLPATRRLPHCTAELIRPFYDFPFGSWAEPEGRRLAPARHAGNGPIGAAIERLSRGSAVGLTLPTPEGGPPLEDDPEIAELAVETVRRILECRPEGWMDGCSAPIAPGDIGLCATHHVMNAAMALRLDNGLTGVAIDTPERWQGLERKIMVIVHPLSGVTQPSEFDLETGRLCVMASRHQISLVVVTRDHLTHTLDTHLPVAGQPIGRPDACGAGHSRNHSFWTALQAQDRVISF